MNDDDMAAMHNQALQEIWQQAEQALTASRQRPLTEDEISLIGWCGNLNAGPNTEKSK